MGGISGREFPLTQQRYQRTDSWHSWFLLILIIHNPCNLLPLEE
jgi:hypothetical protein